MLEPRFLIAETVYSYNGKRINISDKVERVFRQLGRRECELVVIGGLSTSTVGYVKQVSISWKMKHADFRKKHLL